ncbi:MAG TPA: DUF2330 domain-containing protein [Armatimonadota bacterium]|nr:DUF2330 domain-containing protein [Armatimonadota bacterium]
MRRALFGLVLAGTGAFLLSRPSAEAACCYFSALGQDVNQPAQKAFLTWDPQEGVESFTVQPRFEGNARDFGMVVPTPSRPRLFEMPREFFKELAVFTILRPMPLDKYKSFRLPRRFRGAAGGAALDDRKQKVQVLEAGVVGSLDYKIVQADRASDLYQWLKENRYSYAGDEAALDHYIGKKWFFTVMKIDPMQMKKRPDGGFAGEITPTRFTFASKRLVYPLRITQISVPDQTEALLYIQAPHKVDLPGDWSYQLTWAPMWEQALGFAVPEKLTAHEKAWKPVAESARAGLQSQMQQGTGKDPKWQPTRLEWAKKLDAKDMGMLDGTYAFDRQADADAVRQLKILRGHLREGQWVTKLRKVFRRGEMSTDLEFTTATLAGKVDDMEYIYILPTSPP